MVVIRLGQSEGCLVGATDQCPALCGLSPFTCHLKRIRLGHPRGQGLMDSGTPSPGSELADHPGCSLADGQIERSIGGLCNGLHSTLEPESLCPRCGDQSYP